MANRAYLFSKDSLDGDAWNRPQSPYYDSRWTIPIGWFFLFLPDNMLYHEVKYMNSSWTELKLATSKERAMQNFKNRIHLMQALVNNRLTPLWFEIFINKVADWQGEFILLDPAEIFAGGEVKGGHEAAFKHILHTIANVRASVTSMRLAVEVYVDLANTPDSRLEGDILGYTYW
jgi:hypothetical protein